MGNHKRQPCKSCGGPKPPGRSRKLCDDCAVGQPDDYPSRAAYYQAWAASNQDKVRSQAQAYIAQGRARLLEFKATGCTDCGEMDLRCLQIDHVDGKTLGSAGLINCSVKRREAELALCEVRCANCHLKRHVSLGTFVEAGRKAHLKAVG